MKRSDRVKQILDMSPVELNEELASLKAELFNLRFQLAVNQLENPMRIRVVKKDIARIKTIMRERELSGSAE